MKIVKMLVIKTILGALGVPQGTANILQVDPKNLRGYESISKIPLFIYFKTFKLYLKMSVAGTTALSITTFCKGIQHNHTQHWQQVSLC